MSSLVMSEWSSGIGLSDLFSNSGEEAVILISGEAALSMQTTGEYPGDGDKL